MNKVPTLLILLVGLLVAPAHARTPYATWAIGPGGELFRVQDAYTPVAEVALPLSAPQDMFLAPDGSLYVADTGHGRIVKLDNNLQIVAEFGLGILQSPTGLFVDERGTLYIADVGKNAVVILGRDGSLLRQLGHPTEPLFGRGRQFRPRKIAVDARENLYIVSEGSVNGLVMMNTNGNFIGYFGANMAAMSLELLLRRLFLTREQLEQFVRVEAASPSNVAIDHRGLVYTATAGTASDRSIRKFNISGRNLLQEVYGSTTFRDLHVSESGLLVAVDANGRIFEYDLNGTLLFVFGAPDRGDQRLGLLSDPTAILRVGDYLYVLDRARNAIVIYRATEFANSVHNGVRLHTEGFYQEARSYFLEVLAANGLFIMAYQALADAYFKQGDYALAINFYRLAEDRGGYSEAFWELRNAVLQQYLGSALLALLGFGLAASISTRLIRRHGRLELLRDWARRAQKIRLVDDAIFLFRFIKQPVDSFYYIKQDLRGSLLFALLLYAWLVIARILELYLTSFVFSPFASPAQIHVATEVVYVVLPLLLWNAANYLVATISDGEGRLRHVIIGSAYSLFPYALLALPIALLSNLLTLNEAFIYTLATQLIWFWSGLMLFIMVGEVHNYSVSETVRNILITLFTMAMFLLAGYILYVLFNQLYEFITAILQEVGLRG